MNAESTDIAIVGGGMVGISLALMLAQQNAEWRVTLIEAYPVGSGEVQAPFQSSFDARSTALSAGSRALLDAIGLWASLREHVTPIRQVHVSDRSHFGGSLIEAADYGLDAVGYVLENAWLGQVLSAALTRQTAIECLAPASVTRARPLPSGYRLELEEEGRSRQLDCGLLILADGVESRLREQLGMGMSVKDYGQSAIVANVSSDRPHNGTAYERFTSNGPVALLPLGESDESRTMALVWTRPQAQGPELLNASEKDFLSVLQGEFGYRQGIFTGLSKRHLYPLKLSLAREQTRRSLVLMGNAAHSLHPVAGQGFNLALRDCAALSNALAEGLGAGRPIGDPQVLDNYLKAQRSDQSTTIGLSHNFVRWFSSAQLSHSILRNLGMFALDTLPMARHLLARQTMGLL